MLVRTRMVLFKLKWALRQTLRRRTFTALSPKASLSAISRITRMFTRLCSHLLIHFNRLASKI